MPRLFQIYHPTHNQHIKRTRLNVMGRTLSKEVKHISAYLDRALIRRIRVANSGTFECRMDLSGLEGKHEVEIRSIIGHRTERLVIPILVSLESEEISSSEDKTEAASAELLEEETVSVEVVIEEPTTESPVKTEE